MAQGDFTGRVVKGLRKLWGAALRETAARAGSELASMAAAELARIRCEEGDRPGAIAAYQQAAASTQPALRAACLCRLGQLLLQQSEDTTAVSAAADRSAGLSALEDAVAVGHPKSSIVAAAVLGPELDDAGDDAGARRAFEVVMTSGHPVHAPRAALRYGQLLLRAGDREAAHTALRFAVAAAPPRLAARAALALGRDLWRTPADRAEARTLMWQAADSNQDIAATAAIELATLLHQLNDSSGVRRALDRVLAADSATRPERELATHLDTHLQRSGFFDPEIVEDLMRLEGQRFGTSSAERELDSGLSAALAGNLASACAHFRRALTAPQARVATAAAVNLGIALRARGRLARVSGSFRPTADDRNRSAAFRAALNLARALARSGEPDAARCALSRAVEVAEEPVLRLTALFELAILDHENGRTADARAAYQEIVEAGVPDLAAAAGVNLGLLLEDIGDIPAARSALHRVVGSGHPVHADRAAKALRYLSH